MAKTKNRPILIERSVYSPLAPIRCCKLRSTLQRLNFRISSRLIRFYFGLQCDSPYIIKFYSAFFVENRISICTEFMDGKFYLIRSSCVYVRMQLFSLCVSVCRWVFGRLQENSRERLGPDCCGSESPPCCCCYY